MRLRNFGLMVGGASVVVAIRLAVFAVAGLGLVLAQKDADTKPKVSDSPLTAEQLAVYRAVLQRGRREDAKQSVNLSVETVPLDSDSRRCGDGFNLEPMLALQVHRFRPQDLPLLGPGKFSLVDPVSQSKEIAKNDPSKRRNGTSADVAVKNAFAHGMEILTEIQFDKGHTHAIVGYRFYCGGLCGSGGTDLLEKKDGTWHFANPQNDACTIWMS